MAFCFIGSEYAQTDPDAFVAKPRAMVAPDLRRTAPRRWNVALGGIRWLPRLIDKARAALAGTLGGYLYGQSPVDRDFLRTLGMRYRDFTEIVRAADSDDAVLAALDARVPEGVDRLRAWSDRLGVSERRTFMHLLDVDDGYEPGLEWMKTPANVASNAVCAAIKALWPSRAVLPPGDAR